MVKYALLRRPAAVGSAVGLGAAFLLLLSTPAFAHHPFGGEAPKNLFEGIVSGIGHPILGLDHFAFIVAMGLLAAIVRNGFAIPLSFLIAAVVGTGLHLSELHLPATELVISGSVLVFGAIAASRRSPGLIAITILAAIAGVFHGYAYGEAIVGAEPTPLVAYLMGFTGVQGAIAYVAYFLANRTLKNNPSLGLVSIRNAGFVICGAGVAFLGGLLA
ncbi:MAG: HupE/UreJ family protein [Phormidesmis sp.]